MSFGEHLDELRTRLLRSAVALALSILGALFFYRELFQVATLPHTRALSWLGKEGGFIIGTLQGSTGAVMKLASIVGVFVASPVVARELWGFVAAGLHTQEKRAVRIFAPISYLLFLLGCVSGYFILIPQALYSMMTMLPLESVRPVLEIGAYLNLVMTLTILLGTVFQLPLVMVFFAQIGLCTPAQYRSWRRPASVANLAGAALLAPPDLLSMLLFVLPLFLLYEIGILASGLSLQAPKGS